MHHWEPNIVSNITWHVLCVCELILIQNALQSMLKNVRGKGIELDYNNKRMRLIRGVVKPIIKEKSNMLLELPIVMHPNILTLSCNDELTFIFSYYRYM